MMYFFQPNVTLGIHILDGDEFQHCTKVLRKKSGDEIGITDGKGMMIKATIIHIAKRELTFAIDETIIIPIKPFKIHLAIAPTKSIDRMEWMVEKACELGVDEITFLQTTNSERPKLKLDRLEKKAISALKQSKSGYLTILNPLIKFSDFLSMATKDSMKFIAVVNQKNEYFGDVIQANTNTTILIGPEGDFSETEVNKSVAVGFQAISIGKNVLRTETAGIVACQMVNMSNRY